MHGGGEAAPRSCGRRRLRGLPYAVKCEGVSTCQHARQRIWRCRQPLCVDGAHTRHKTSAIRPCTHTHAHANTGAHAQQRTRELALRLISYRPHPDASGKAGRGAWQRERIATGFRSDPPKCTAAKPECAVSAGCFLHRGPLSAARALHRRLTNDFLRDLESGSTGVSAGTTC